MRNNKKAYNYGRCHVCGEPMVERLIKQDFWIKEKLLVIEDVPAGVCLQCGEKVVRADVGRHISAMLENSKMVRGARTLKIPVIRFAKEVA